MALPMCRGASFFLSLGSCSKRAAIPRRRALLIVSFDRGKCFPAEPLLSPRLQESRSVRLPSSPQPSVTSESDRMRTELSLKKS
jgi:hypothetical protein